MSDVEHWKPYLRFDLAVLDLKWQRAWERAEKVGVHDGAATSGLIIPRYLYDHISGLAYERRQITEMVSIGEITARESE